MRILFITILILFVKIQLFGCCAGDDRTLTEILFQRNMGTIFSCKILSMSVPKQDGDIIVHSSSGSIEGTATAQIIKIYFGTVDTSIITLNTGSYLTIGKSYLIYTDGKGRIFSCGGGCDTRMHELTGSLEELSELKILSQFADIFKYNKSGKYTFLSATKKILATGEFKKGLPINIWKHYFASGILKTEQDFQNKRTKIYYGNGFILNDNIEYKDSTVSFTYSNIVSGQLKYRWVTIPNEKGSILSMYEYYPNGYLKLHEGQQNINERGGGFSCEGKIGKYVEGYENGKIKLTGEYLKTKRIGIWKWYNEDGSFSAEVDYKDGATQQ